MKTKIAIILILIAEIFAAFFVGLIFTTDETCGVKTFYTPPYFTLSFFIAFALLLIAACILWTQITKTFWFSCVTLAIINLGIMCWGAVYYFGTHCDGPHEIKPDSFLATMSIIIAAIIALSLPLFLSDIKRIIRITVEGNMDNKTTSSLPVTMVGIAIFMLLIVGLIRACSGGVYATCKSSAYYTAHEQIQNAVTAYMSDSNHSSQLPIISENATFTLTNPNGTYYIINMSALLTTNGGMLRQVPSGCGQLPGPNNDNCDGGATGCENTSHYIWGIDNNGTVVSKSYNSYLSNEPLCNACSCKCNTCDGYQDVWP